MTDIVAFIEALGGLHDCTVLTFRWEPANGRLIMDIEDIYWNFEGLPEYPGAQAGAFTFSEITTLKVNIPPVEPVDMIGDFKISRSSATGYLSEIWFSSGGHIEVHCGEIICNQSLAATISASA